MTLLKYFKTDGIRGKVGHHPITPNFLLNLGWSIGTVLGKNKNKKIIIGRDTRISGSMLQSIVEFGILSTGVSTLLAECIPTSAIAYFTRFFNASGGVVISASHNLFYDNGIKIFYKNGIKLTKKIELNIENYINDTFCYSNINHFGFSQHIINPERQYINFCKNTFPKNINLSYFTIVLDCANGATSNIASKVFQELGAKVITISANPNGVNINENSGSTNTVQLKKRVLLEQANIGLAFDGDGDRVIMIDHLGNQINGDQIIYIIAKEYLKNKQLLGGVVGTLMTNIGLILSLKKLGIPFYQAKIGDRNIYQKMKEKKWILGGEQSGHIILLDKHSTGDGIIASLQVFLSMINNNTSLYHLTHEIKLFPQVLLNISLKNKKKFYQHVKIKNILNKYQDILGKNSLVSIRESGTEPCVRIMVQGENYSKVHELSQYISETIKLL
ncbi:phosphoglucosamine mutase [Buchnera aphidicola (Macrosiphoniella sanborni)]|uniref:Phosphoglucosamine mutase n=1 Tax=Buchnera aphidicola (Macrosiphoniella sanborni) TaxID=1241865 RepID=A0A4D6Y3Q4_9GAMM|nr:phosphoglucosamine mutase [Buchnera aphidicola]QCI23907.1 phosphoglucosamine mutase [Buchnera aphidicola (Macrosiphoniella sanborni)]